MASLSHGLIAACPEYALTSRLFSSHVMDADKSRQVSIRGTSMRFSLGSSSIDHGLLGASGGCIFEARERETFEFLDTHLRDGDVFYDIGANFGLYVVYCAAKTRLKHVVALEPEALNYAELCRNIRLNGLDHVTALCVGASDRAAFEKYYLRGFFPGNHSGRTRRYLGGESIDAPAGENTFVPGYAQTITLLPLDEIVPRAGVPMPNVLLMDVDGGEEHALSGMQGILRNEALRAAIVEIEAGDRGRPARELMEACGFRFAGGGGESRSNAFFVRQGDA